MTDHLALILMGGGALTLGVMAHMRGKNPWKWGVVGAFFHVIAVIAWLAYYWQDPEDQANVATQEESAAPVQSAAAHAAQSDLEGQLPTAIDNPGFVLNDTIVRGMLEPAVVWNLPDCCLNCGNRNTCYDDFTELRNFGRSTCDEYQRDESLHPFSYSATEDNS